MMKANSIDATSWANPETRPAGISVDWIFVTVFLVTLLSAAWPFLHPSETLAYFQDDFFYYLQVARNLAEHGRSTFDGSTPTNGYHPLWLLTLTLAWLPGDGRFVFVLVSCIVVAAVSLTYLATQRLLRRTTLTTPAIAFASAWTALFALSLDRTGMEVILTLPFAIWWIDYVLDSSFLETSRGAVVAGLLASAVVLSRLDTMLLLIIYGAFLLLAGQGRLLLRRAGWLALGLSPLFVYLVSNAVFFGSLTPISSQAKHLRHGYMPDPTALISIFEPLGLVALAFICPALILVTLGVIAVIRRRTAAPPILSAVLLFMPLYFGTLSIVSDWRVWPWYRYPIVLAGVAAILLIFRRDSVTRTSEALRGRLWAIAFQAASLTLCGLFCIGLLKPPQNRDIYDIALRLRQFAQTHPGRYAMGDAAGTPAFLLGQPVVQLEGLMMDKHYLENIRQQRNLLDVLRDYNIHYYVALNAGTGNGCSHFVEPVQAGRYSPHMTATLCQQPADAFTIGTYDVSIFDLIAGGGKYPPSPQPAEVGR